jgi:predicted PurR-regulated permease PerM
VAGGKPQTCCDKSLHHPSEKRQTKEKRMRKSALLTGLIPMVCVLLLTIIAGRHSLAVSRMYDQRMRADIQICAKQLTETGLSSAQVQTLQTVLNEVNHNTLSFVSSEVDSLVSTIGFMGIIIMSAVLALALRTANQTKPD